MSFVFERGSETRPKGHALLYFRNASDASEVWATYVVILPVSVDVSKYVPPFLMNQVGDLSPKDLSAFAFPPAPELFPTREGLEAMAAVREDDLLFGGAINPRDISSALMAVTGCVQHYTDLYVHAAEASLAAADPTTEETGDGLGVNAVLYGFMSDRDKLEELTKLVGRLRFAVEGAEERGIREAEEDVRLLARYLEGDHRISALVRAVKGADPRSFRLADLYLQRCFHLIAGEHAKLSQVEEEIAGLQPEGEA